MMDLTGKTALITGASRGIGKAIALKLAGQGANIAIPYLGDPAEAEQAQKEIEALGVKCVMYVCDVSSFEASKEVVEKVIEEFGGVDILVNNAGIVRDKPDPLHEGRGFRHGYQCKPEGCFQYDQAHLLPLYEEAQRQNHQYFFHRGPERQRGPGQLLQFQGRPDWPDQIHRQRAWRQKHHCQRYRSRVYRYGYDPAAIRQGKGRHEGADPHEASRHPGGYRQSRPVLSLG